MPSHYKQQLIDWLGTKSLKARSVVSIGCQHDDRKYFKSFDCEEYKTIDHNQDFAPSLLHDMNFTLFPDDFENEWSDRFDAVLALELMEYIFDPLTAHKNIAGLLKNGGETYISYPFVYGQHPPDGMDYLRYTPDGAEKLLRAAGLTMVEHVKRFGNDLLPKFYDVDRMRTRKDVDHRVTGSLIIAKKL